MQFFRLVCASSDWLLIILQYTHFYTQNQVLGIYFLPVLKFILIRKINKFKRNVLFKRTVLRHTTA